MFPSRYSSVGFLNQLEQEENAFAAFLLVETSAANSVRGFENPKISIARFANTEKSEDPRGRIFNYSRCSLRNSFLNHVSKSK